MLPSFKRDLEYTLSEGLIRTPDKKTPSLLEAGFSLASNNWLTFNGGVLIKGSAGEKESQKEIPNVTNNILIGRNFKGNLQSGSSNMIDKSVVNKKTGKAGIVRLFGSLFGWIHGFFVK